MPGRWNKTQPTKSWDWTGYSKSSRETSGKGQGTRKPKTKSTKSDRYVCCVDCNCGGWAFLGKDDKLPEHKKCCSYCGKLFPSWEQHQQRPKAETPVVEPSMDILRAIDPGLAVICQEAVCRMVNVSDPRSKDIMMNLIKECAGLKVEQPCQSFDVGTPNDQTREAHDKFQKERIKLHNAIPKIENEQKGNSLSIAALEKKLSEAKEKREALVTDFQKAKSELDDHYRRYNAAFPNGYHFPDVPAAQLGLDPSGTDPHVPEATMGGTNAAGQSIHVAASEAESDVDFVDLDDKPDDNPETAAAKAVMRDAKAFNKEVKDKNALAREANLKKKLNDKGTVHAKLILKQNRVYKTASDKAAEAKSRAADQAGQQTPTAHHPGESQGVPAPDTPTFNRVLANQFGQVSPAAGDQDPPGEDDDKDL